MTAAHTVRRTAPKGFVRTALLTTLAVCSLLAACTWDLARFKDSKTITAPAMADHGLIVETRNGSVTVTRADVSEVMIAAEVRAQTEERAKAAKVRAERDASGTLIVGIDWPGGSAMGGEGATFDIRVPSARGVVIKTGNGRISLTGCAGPADLRTSNGTIIVDDHDGPVTAQSSNGEINLDFVEGAIDAQTSNGRITITDAAAAVKARTSNGRVRIALTNDNAGPVEAKSSNGTMTLMVGPAFAGELHASTSNGGVTIADGAVKGAKTIEKARASARIVFAASGGESTLRTSNGAITIDVAPADTRGNLPATTPAPRAPAPPPGSPV